MVSEELEKIRNRINMMISVENISSYEVLKASQEMDILILEYLKDKKI